MESNKRLTLKSSNFLSENMLGEPQYLRSTSIFFITDHFLELTKNIQSCTGMLLVIFAFSNRTASRHVCKIANSEY